MSQDYSNLRKLLPNRHGGAINITKDVLEELYWKKRLSSSKIGKLAGLRGETVLKRMARFGVPRRSSSESHTKIVYRLPQTEFEKGLIVGLLVGEGTLTMRKRPWPVPSVAISNTDKKIMKALHKILGAPIRVARKKTVKGKKIYRLSLSNQKFLYDLFTILEPLMVAKRQQCKLIKEFCEIRLSKPNRYPYGSREYEICEEVQTLNKRTGRF
jgi:hypothetical protein